MRGSRGSRTLPFGKLYFRATSEFGSSSACGHRAAPSFSRFHRIPLKKSSYSRHMGEGELGGGGVAVSEPSFIPV